MTKVGLRGRLIVIAIALIAIIVLGIFLKFVGPSRYYDLLKDMFPLFITLAAVYLSHSLQERGAFLTSLRSLWGHLIEAKITLVRYTHDPSPTWETYQDAFDSISRAIDEMRGVYRNVGESDQEIGHFPYEPVHDMRRALLELGHREVTPQRQEEARRKITTAWYALRPRFLSELGPPEPTSPMLEQDAVDRRRRPR